jgi:hypothetical protein
MILRIALLLVSLGLLVHGAEGFYRGLTLQGERPGLLLPALESAVGAAGLAALLLWWMRSRRRAPVQPATPAKRPGPVAQPSPPEGPGSLAFSRLMLVNLPPRAAASALENAPPLGSQSAIRSAFSRVLPGIQFNDDGVGQFEGPGHAIRVDLGSGEQAWTATLDVSGQAAAPALKRLIIQTGWQAYAPKLGRFITAEDLKA